MNKHNLIKQWNDLMKVFGTEDDEAFGGTVFATATLDELKQAIQIAPDFWKGNMQYNSAPLQRMFLEFMEENPEFVADITMIEPTRTDYRINITGVKAPYNKESESNLYFWVNQLVDNSDEYGLDIGQPEEYGEYNGYIRAWWD